MSVVETLEGLQGASLASVAVGAHEALAADAVALVLAAAEVAGALGAHLVAARVNLPAEHALGEVEVGVRVAVVPGEGAEAGERLGLGRHYGNDEEDGDAQREERDGGGVGGAVSVAPSPMLIQRLLPLPRRLTRRSGRGRACRRSGFARCSHRSGRSVWRGWPAGGPGRW